MKKFLLALVMLLTTGSAFAQPINIVPRNVGRVEIQNSGCTIKVVTKKKLAISKQSSFVTLSE